MANNVIQSKSIKWVHVTNVEESDLAYLQENFRFHHLDYEDIRVETPISKMDTYKHYIFCVFHIPTVHQETGHVSGEELYMFVSQDSVVTVSHVHLPAVETFFDRLDKSAKFRASIMGKGSMYLMYKILHEAFKESLKIASDLSQEVSRLERAIETEHNKSITVDLGHARRNVLYNRHIIDPQRAMLSSLSNTKRTFITSETVLYLDDLHDLLDTVWLTSDNLKLIVDGLFDVNEALLSHKTNEIITLLTIVSAAFMVPTFIAGFYGMNVSWLPFSEQPGIVGMFYLASFIIMIIVVYTVMKRPRS